MFSIIPFDEETEEVAFLVACSNIRAVDFCVCVCVCVYIHVWQCERVPAILPVGLAQAPARFPQHPLKSIPNKNQRSLEKQKPGKHL